MQLRKADRIVKGDWVLLPGHRGLASFQEIISISRVADTVSFRTAQGYPWTGRRYFQLWVLPADWKPPALVRPKTPVSGSIRVASTQQT